MTAKIALALHNVMQKVGYIQRTGKNAFHGYKYAGEADLLDKLRPAMIEEGLLLIPSVDDVSPIDEHGNTFVRVSYTLLHKDGEVWPEKIVAAGCGNDRNKNGVGDKGVYKALTGANKYLLFKLFQIETGDDPEATEGAERAAKGQKPPKDAHEDESRPDPSDTPMTGSEAFAAMLAQQAEILNRAALKGVKSLEQAWKDTPRDLKTELKAELDGRLKQIAKNQDAIQIAHSA